MRKLASSIAGALLIAGCDSSEVREAHRAEQRLAMVKADAGDKDAVCAASREVADAWLRALDEGKYQLAEVRAALDCNEAALDRLRY